MNKFYLGIIAVLIAIIFLQRACTPKCTKTRELVTIYDTILKHDSSVVVKKMKIASHDTTYIPEDPIYMFDTSCDIIKERFQKLFIFFYKESLSLLSKISVVSVKMLHLLIFVIFFSFFFPSLESLQVLNIKF